MSSEREELSKARAWTISRIELFVVLAVIGILTGMLIPAIYQVRTAAQRAQSQNNLRQIALCTMNFESAHMKFPAVVNHINDGTEGFGWALAIVPFMESSNLYARVDENESWNSIENSFVVSRSCTFYTSPLEDKIYTTAGFGVVHYAACSELISGKKSVIADDEFEWSQFMFGEIGDGYESWAKPGSCRGYGNGIRFDAASFGSPVLDGALMARANGKVEFVSSTLSRPTQTFVGKREQGSNGQPNMFGYEAIVEYSPTVKGWRANCWFAPNSKVYGGGKALDDEGLKRITQHDGLVSLILGGAHEVTGTGLKSLHKSSVTRLNIGLRNLMQDEDLKILHGMDQLQCLRLTDGEFSNESVEKLRLALPDCEVIER